MTRVLRGVVQRGNGVRGYHSTPGAYMRCTTLLGVL